MWEERPPTLVVRALLHSGVPTERRDVVRNRAALVAAAARVFSERGAAAPLAEVASEAGVGRATLHRHFPERHLLAAAVYHQHIDDVVAFVAANGGDDCPLELVVRRIVAGQSRLAGLFPLLRSTPEAADALLALGARFAALLAAPLAAAQRRGEVDPSVTVDDVQLVLTMIEGVLASYDGGELTIAIDRAVTIALAGLRRGALAGDYPASPS